MALQSEHYPAPHPMPHTPYDWVYVGIKLQYRRPGSIVWVEAEVIHIHPAGTQPTHEQHLAWYGSGNHTPKHPLTVKNDRIILRKLTGSNVGGLVVWPKSPRFAYLMRKLP